MEEEASGRCAGPVTNEPAAPWDSQLQSGTAKKAATIAVELGAVEKRAVSDSSQHGLGRCSSAAAGLLSSGSSSSSSTTSTLSAASSRAGSDIPILDRSADAVLSRERGNPGMDARVAGAGTVAFVSTLEITTASAAATCTTQGLSASPLRSVSQRKGSPALDGPARRPASARSLLRNEAAATTAGEDTSSTATLSDGERAKSAVHGPPTHTHTLADMAKPAPAAAVAGGGVGGGVVSAAAEAGCLSPAAIAANAVKSENALLVAAGVVSDDETESLVHFVVPKAAIHQGLQGRSLPVPHESSTHGSAESLGQHPHDGLPVMAAGAALAGVGSSGSLRDVAMGAGSPDLDMLQCDGPSPVKRRSQRQSLSRQPSAASSSARHSPRASVYSRRPLSLSEPMLNVYPFVEPRHPGQLLCSMEKLWNDKRLCDVVLCVDGRRIPAHKVVLSAVSDYFHAMFAGEMAESRMSEVVIHDVDGAAMVQLVGYAYTCKLDIHSQNVQSLLKASSILQMKDVMAACQRYMSEQLHPSNCLGIRLFSQQFGCVELYKSAEKFVEECFLDVIKQEEYLQLGIDDVVEMLSRDDVNVENECQVYEAVLRWIRHTGSDGQDHSQHIAKLLACVRLPFLPAEYIADHVETEEVIKSSAQCQPLLLEALKYHLLPERCILSENPRTQPRRSTVGSLFAVGGMDLSRGAMTIEEYNYRLNEWQTVGEMRSRRLQCGVAVVGRYIYTVGGRDGLKTLNSVERFDTRHRTWSSVASMCTHRHGVGVAVLSGPMYAVGGHDGWSYLNTVERYDPDLNSWSFLAPMNAARSTAGVAVLNGKLYAVGGRDSISCLSSMECYDPHRNRWNTCAPMSQRRGGVGVAVCNGKLFAVGGHEQATPFDLVECYDPVVEQWACVTPMMSCRDAVGVTCFANKLFAVGGYNGYMYLNSVECLNLASRKWENKSVLCTGRAGAGVVAVKDTDPPDDEDLGSAL